MINFISAHPYYAYSAIFLAALSEAIPVVGTVVPGSTLVVAISALAAGAGANSWLLLVAATVGAIVGDGVSFWLGRRYHREILRSWPLNRYPKLVERSNRFITRFGAASVFLARFTAVVRAFVPLIAGILRMSPLQFYIATFCSLLYGHPLTSSRCAARDGTEACWGERRAAYCSHYRRADRCIGRCRGHTACFCAFVVFQCRHFNHSDLCCGDVRKFTSRILEGLDPCRGVAGRVGRGSVKRTPPGRCCGVGAGRVGSPSNDIRTAGDAARRTPRV